MATLLLVATSFVALAEGLLLVQAFLALRYERKERKDLMQQFDLLNHAFSLVVTSKAETTTAEEIVKRRAPFHLRETWSQQRARLEREHATKDQQHERRVQEIEATQEV